MDRMFYTAPIVGVVLPLWQVKVGFHSWYQFKKVEFENMLIP